MNKRCGRVWFSRFFPHKGKIMKHKCCLVKGHDGPCKCQCFAWKMFLGSLDLSGKSGHG